MELRTEERQECEVYCRTMGYYRPVSEYNKGKKSEFYERKNYNEEVAVARLNEMNQLAA